MTDTDKLVERLRGTPESEPWAGSDVPRRMNFDSLPKEFIALMTEAADALASLKAEKREAERERDTYRDLLDSNVKQMGKQLADIGRERGRLRAEVDALSRAKSEGAS